MCVVVKPMAVLTVNVGFDTADEVTDSTTEPTELEASAAAEETEEARPSPSSCALATAA